MTPAGLPAAQRAAPPRRSARTLSSAVAHPPHAVSAVVGDEDRSVGHLQQTDRTAPRLLLLVVARDEPGQKVFRRAGRCAVVAERDADDRVAGELRAVD